MSGWPLLSVVYESRGYVWDAGLLEWVPETQAGGGGGDATAANQVIEIARLTSILADTNTLVARSAALTASAPTAATVGTSSAQALASNASRRRAVFVNTSAATISLGFSGQAAVLNSGVTLDSGASFTMGEDLLTLGQVNAIASAVSSNLAIQEYT